MDLSHYQDAASATPPTPPASPSVGYPSLGNPAIGAAATAFGAYWVYQLQAELGAVIGAAGITPDASNLTQLLAALQVLGAPELPLAALPFPTVATADHRLSITCATVAGHGGTVSIGAGERLSLGREAAAGETGRLLGYITPAWTSPVLVAAARYYVRAKIVAGALTLYVQRGAESDAVPGGLVGTVDGTSGGGFPSTVLDAVLAFVDTGAAGSAPAVTALANGAMLLHDSSAAGTPSAEGGYAWSYSRLVALNWARPPRFVNWSGSVRAPTVGGGVGVQGGANYLTGVAESRLALEGVMATDWNDAPATLVADLRVVAFA